MSFFYQANAPLHNRSSKKERVAEKEAHAFEWAKEVENNVMAQKDIITWAKGKIDLLDRMLKRHSIDARNGAIEAIAAAMTAANAAKESQKIVRTEKYPYMANAEETLVAAEEAFAIQKKGH